MILMKYFIDLSKTDNQILVAKEWFIYQDLVIIPYELRYKIISFTEEYHSGMITNMELYNLILDAIHQEFLAFRN